MTVASTPTFPRPDVSDVTDIDAVKVDRARPERPLQQIDRDHVGIGDGGLDPPPPAPADQTRSRA